jgi:hypothetical protein
VSQITYITRVGTAQSLPYMTQPRVDPVVSAEQSRLPHTNAESPTPVSGLGESVLSEFD